MEDLWRLEDAELENARLPFIQEGLICYRSHDWWLKFPHQRT